MSHPPGPRPHLWVYPNDPSRMARHLAYQRARAQAKFRGDQFTLTEDEWMDIWTIELWARRGRSGLALCLIRDNANGPWSKDNVLMVTRRTQLIIQKGNPQLKEIEPGIWDVTGDALDKWERNQKKMSKYKGRYKYEKRKTRYKDNNS